MFNKLLKLIARLVLKKELYNFENLVVLAYQKYIHDYNNTISLNLVKFLISGEDHRFYYHSGVDILSIFRAIWHRIFLSKIEGASTINMQVVRVLTNKYELKFSRKIKEMLFAELLEDIIPKNEIPGLYLSIAYFGWKMNGLKQACKRLKYNYKIINNKDSASLVARLKYPEPQNFIPKRIAQIYKRQNYLINLYNKYSADKSNNFLIERNAYGSF
jgi:membrane peptidoglycan carboxypeptidase